MTICLLAENEIIFGVDMPPSEETNLVDISLLLTAKGILVKYAEKRMHSWPGTSFMVGKALSM